MGMIQLSRRKDIQSLNLRIILLRFFDPHQTKLIIIISDCRRPEKEDATFTSSYVISVPRPLISLPILFFAQNQLNRVGRYQLGMKDRIRIVVLCSD